MTSHRVPVDHAPITQVSRRAMATDFGVMISGGDRHLLESAVSALEELESIESALTVYRESSEISRVNQFAERAPVRVSPTTFQLLHRSVAWSLLTEGAFDVTSGPLVEAWGFMRRRGQKPSAAEIESAMARVGHRFLQFDDEDLSIRFLRCGMSINLGAIGKGHALDLLAERLRDAGASDFFIHGGHSSVIAQGDQVPGSGLGWAVGIAHPTKPRHRVAGIWLRNSALGTSGSGKQFFHHRGRRFGHVIDPRTGQPAGDLLSLTVVMRSATDADACATGLFVCGSDESKRLAAGIAESLGQEIPLILVRPGVRQDQIELETDGEITWVGEPEGE